MNKSAKTLTTTHKLALAGVLCAVAVVGSLLSFPVLGSKCAPVQHMVNILCAVVLGPWYGVGVAFVASLAAQHPRHRQSHGLPRQHVRRAAVRRGVLEDRRTCPLTLIAEVFGTGIIGGFAAYPIAKYLMGLTPAAYTVYIVPFLISTVAGSILAGILVAALRKAGVPGLAAKA